MLTLPQADIIFDFVTPFAYVCFIIGVPIIVLAVSAFIGSMVTFASGLYFAILTVIITIDSFETNIVDEWRDRIMSIRSKLFISITLIVLTFLIGSAGVTLHPIYRGSPILQAQPVILGVLSPFLGLTVVAVYFLSRSLYRLFGDEPANISYLVNPPRDILF